MNPEVLLPQSAAVQAFGYGLVAGSLLFGVVCWFWGRACGWDAGLAKGHGEGWIKGVNDAVEIERLSCDEGAIQEGMQRHDRAVAEWKREGRR